MSLYILDTDHITFFQHGHPLVIQRVNSLQPEELATTVVTAEEQMRGRLNAIHRATSHAALVRTYKNLSDTIEFFKQIQVLEFTDAAAQRLAELLELKLRVGTQDLRISAIALSLNAIVVTRNQRDFGQVPDLALEDWTI